MLHHIDFNLKWLCVWVYKDTEIGLIIGMKIVYKNKCNFIYTVIVVSY